MMLGTLSSSILNPLLSYKMFVRYLLLFFVISAFGCAKAPPPDPELVRISDWQKFVEDTRSSSLQEKLALVNNYFNQFKYVEDEDLYGSNDYWATLRETLGRHSGDCEDFAIAKYFTLRDLELDEEKMRITYVIPLQTRQPHMVLTYKLGETEEPIVLDSRVNVLMPVSRRNDLVPVYSFNTQGYWIARKDARWQGERVGPAEKLSLWWRLLQRMVKEDTFYTKKPVILTGG